jgi:hypothetical protein
MSKQFPALFFNFPKLQVLVQTPFEQELTALASEPKIVLQVRSSRPQWAISVVRAKHCPLLFFDFPEVQVLVQTPFKQELTALASVPKMVLQTTSPRPQWEISVLIAQQNPLLFFKNPALQVFVQVPRVQVATALLSLEIVHTLFSSPQ